MKKVCVLFLFLLAATFGCQDQHAEAPSFESNEIAIPAGGEADSLQTGESTRNDAPLERVIIRTADISLVSETPDVTASAIQTLAAKLGGFVVSSSTHGGDEITGASLTLRIPAEQFHVALELLREKGEVARESVNGQDVTAEFTDLGARLKTQTELESRLRTLLLQAANVEETIRVEQELARVRTEIERIQGRRNQIENQAKLSTITVHVSTDGDVDAGLSEIEEALDDAGGIMAAVVAGGIRVTAALLPIAATGAFFLLLIVGFVRRRAKRA